MCKYVKVFKCCGGMPFFCALPIGTIKKDY